MKRDMDLVRRILIDVEQSEVPLDVSSFICDEHPTVEDVFDYQSECHCSKTNQLN